MCATSSFVEHTVQGKRFTMRWVQNTPRMHASGFQPSSKQYVLWLQIYTIQILHKARVLCLLQPCREQNTVWKAVGTVCVMLCSGKGNHNEWETSHEYAKSDYWLHTQCHIMPIANGDTEHIQSGSTRKCHLLRAGRHDAVHWDRTLLHCNTLKESFHKKNLRKRHTERRQRLTRRIGRTKLNTEFTKQGITTNWARYTMNARQVRLDFRKNSAAPTLSGDTNTFLCEWIKPVVFLLNLVTYTFSVVAFRKLTPKNDHVTVLCTVFWHSRDCPHPSSPSACH